MAFNCSFYKWLSTIHKNTTSLPEDLQKEICCVTSTILQCMKETRETEESLSTSFRVEFEYEESNPDDITMIISSMIWYDALGTHKPAHSTRSPIISRRALGVVFSPGIVEGVASLQIPFFVRFVDITSHSFLEEDKSLEEIL